MGRRWCCGGRWRGGNKPGDRGPRFPAEGDNSCLAWGCAEGEVKVRAYGEGGCGWLSLDCGGRERCTDGLGDVALVAGVLYQGVKIG